MIIESFPVAPLGCNCVIVGDTAGGTAVVVDPGGEHEKVLQKLGAHGLRCVAILHTHTHFDHVGATADVQASTSAGVMLHESDLFLYQRLQMQLDSFGVPLRAPSTAEVDRFLHDGDTVSIGRKEIGVIHTPGHTPGSLCFVVPTEDTSRSVVLAGDTLFRQSIGRTDLWGGDTTQLLKSIRSKLFTLPDDTLVITGHGPTTTIGDEKRQNPFVQVPHYR